ncbi:SDR family NAD(P)-dependent oxidoreductase [Nocardia testacea]|uniref:SDR family NAD(P)-dependent oxidoreductase n=1 Tax=Nocardia testacea TaxID=248551 RepID=A0ABW7VRU4_9NOCA
MSVLTGKVGIVTAAGSGMGRAGAIRFASAGATVAVVSLEEEETRETLALVEAAGGQGLALAGDLGDEDFARDIVDKTVQKFGRLDFLWNHVGYPGPAAVEDLDLAAFDKTVDLNLRTVMVTTSRAIPHLKKSTDGNVLFTSSSSGLTGSPWSPVYSMAKFGVVGLMRALAKKYGPEGLRFNAVCPGVMDTPMLRVFVARPDDERARGADAEELSRKAAEAIPLRRLGQPEEVANAALFLLSEDASFITGVALPVDGGTVA